MPVLATLSVTLAIACGSEKDVGDKVQTLTAADGAILDGTNDEIGDGWISSESGSSDVASDADAGPLCPGQAGGTLGSFLGADKYIQIDIDKVAQDTGVVGANANLVLGPDPATSPGSPSFNLPAALTSGSPSFIDWENLASSPFSLSDHRLLDVFSGKDPSSFPGADSCVGAANNPAKDELLSVGIGNNNDYVYLNVLRASSLGDMGYTWLFTKDKPACAAQGKCDTWLRYHIQEGDVLVFGHFRTGTALLLDVYKAKTGVNTTLDATAAVEWCNTAVWTEDASGVGAVAVNTDLTHAGAWNNDGLKSPQTGADGQPAFEDHIFAEGAVKTSTFGTNGVCGQTFWTSVISKSSGNACSGADVKDLIGPRQVNFGSVSAQVSVRSNCNGTVDLQATVTGATGTVSCKWYDGDPTVEANKIAESPTCDEVVGVALSEGTHSISVKVSDTGDAGSGCGTTSPSVSVAVHPAPTVTCALTPHCATTSNLDYSATATGQGTLSYSWSLSNSESTTGLPVPTGASGTVTVAPIGAGITYTASTEVTDARGCKASCTPATAVPLAPISVGLTPASVSRVCSATAPQASIDDRVTFSANASGGDGSYTYTWGVKKCTDPSDLTTCTTATCGSAATCIVDPVDGDNPDTSSCALQTISVSVDDGSTLCGAQTAGPRSYKKVTEVTVF